MACGQSSMPRQRHRLGTLRRSLVSLTVCLVAQGAAGTALLPFGGLPPRPSPTWVNVPRTITRSPISLTSRLEFTSARGGAPAEAPRLVHDGDALRRMGRSVPLGARARLAARLLGDVVAAAVASFMISPFISIVDRAIIQSASGSLSMSSSVRQGLRVLLTRPALFLARPDFVVTFGLYAATYVAANTISTVADEMSRSDTWPRFLCTTAINMPGSIAKDQALAKLFGAVGGAARVPAASFALFTVRDVSTMAAAFTLPTPLSVKIQEFGVARTWADGLSQLVSPGLVQVFSTPVHILGLDLYNHPAASLADRLEVVRKAFAPAIVLRVARIGVAFGVGGVGNNAIRQRLHDVVMPDASSPC